MATLILNSPFDTDLLVSPIAGLASIVSQDATTIRYQNVDGYFIELTGTYTGAGAGTAGTTTGIKAYATNAFTPCLSP